MADIADYIETLPNEAIYLFPSRKGGSYISTTQVYRIIVKADDMIGNNSVGTHTKRKTFGYTYYQATKDVATLIEENRVTSLIWMLSYIVLMFSFELLYTTIIIVHLCM